MEDWNEKSRAWLERTGNHKVHGTTKERSDQWGELLGAEGVVTAILDRVLQRVELIQMDDEGY